MFSSGLWLVLSTERKFQGLNGYCGGLVVEMFFFGILR
jgi:hypothetical protein